ncbi:acyl-CoA dehydrogenase family protein [Actinomadura sp. B10D3]|uniref:acyl-CoA dehydrogenase family protein n=1 Tax=Actinomadura sp. B10D3 TaxID=3153557 RepID=UPI00325F0567
MVVRAAARSLDDRVDELLDRCDPRAATAAEFFGAQFDLGLAWVGFGEGEGGHGAPAGEQGRVRARLAAAGAPDHPLRSVIGLGMAAPTIAAHGSPELRRRLRAIFTTEETWCQLFSEPGAGSDLAGLATRAVPVDGGWIVNGQKVWTSYAHVADWGLLLARTDPELPKHRGLTYFALDMRTRGVEVRPLRQITGDAEFNEVFLTDVFVPDTHRLGERGAGWTVAMTTLMNERTALPGNAAGLEDPLDAVLREGAARHVTDPVLLDRLVALRVRGRLIKLTLHRFGADSDGGPGPEGSIGKLLWAEYMKDATELQVDLLGRDAIAYPPGYRLRRTGRPGPGGDVRYDYLRSRAASIEGGTSEIMRGILAERVLGLPREPDPGRGLPWNEGRHG